MIILGATNCASLIDPALLRRFQRQVYFPLPNELQCLEIMIRFFDSLSVSFSKNDLISFSKRLQDWTPCKIICLCEDAARIRCDERANEYFRRGIDKIVYFEPQNMRDIEFQDLEKAFYKSNACYLVSFSNFGFSSAAIFSRINLI